MDIKKYLKLIQVKSPPEVSYKYLKELQYQHLLHIPFENLDIHLNKKIELDVNKFYHKIVIHKRGGYCYELNGLFATLLRKIGYNVHLISARVFSKNRKFGKSFGHLCLLINLHSTSYLVDVGFGSFTSFPLKLTLNEIQEDPAGSFYFKKYYNYYQICKIENKSHQPAYIFKLTPYHLEDFSKTNEYHQTSPLSTFTSKKVISKLTLNGRITLNNQQLKITDNKKISIVEFPETAFEKMVFKHFGIQLSSAKKIK